MYERSVIVLERYMEDILGLNKQNNLKNNFYTYKEMVDVKPENLEKKLIRIESQIEKNNTEVKTIRRDYVETLQTFFERQKERNICARKKKGTDANHVITIRKTRQLFDMIDKEDLKRMKNFVDGDKKLIKEQIFNIMMENRKK